MTSLEPVAAARLLQRWVLDPETGHSAYGVVPILGSAPPPAQQLWAPSPTLAEVAEYGRFPETFAAEGSLGHRHPLAAEPLNHAVHNPGEPWTSARRAGEVAVQIDRLLTDALSLGPETLDERPRELIAVLARELAARYSDLTVTAQVAGDSNDSLPLAYGIGLPFELSDKDYGFYGCLLLVGSEFVGIITIQAMA